jgi:hypothetical protein
MEFEREHKDFRGVNDKGVRSDQRSTILVDTLDIGLYGQIDVQPVPPMLRCAYRLSFARPLPSGSVIEGSGDSSVKDGGHKQIILNLFALVNVGKLQTRF